MIHFKRYDYDRPSLALSTGYVTAGASSRISSLLTSFHEVAVGGVSWVCEDVVLDGVELREVVQQERVARSRRAVVVQVGELDASIDEEAQRIGREVHRQDDEVDPVVAVEQVDAKTAAVQAVCSATCQGQHRRPLLYSALHSIHSRPATAQ